MLFAERHGKLGRDSSRAHDRAEDLLTSTAFQLLRYIPPKAGLFAVLERVRTVRWNDGQVVVSQERPAWLPCHLADNYDPEFWPWWPGAGEPDVVLCLRQNQMTLARIVVEVKLHSPKSARRVNGPNDEDDDEDSNGERRCPDQLWDYAQQLKQDPGNHAWGLVYLTSHSTPPLEELRESLACSVAGHVGDWLGWLSWSDVWAVMDAADSNLLPAHDLADILAEKGLNVFNGFRPSPWPVPPQPWGFFQRDNLWRFQQVEKWLVPPQPWGFFHPWFSPEGCWSRPAGPQSFWETQEVRR